MKNVLKRLREKIRKKRSQLWRDNSWFLHYDNASLSLINSQVLCQKSDDCPLPASPDLALYDFLFPKLKSILKIKIQFEKNTKTRCTQIIITLKLKRCKQFKKKANYSKDYNNCSAINRTSLECFVAE